MPLPPAAISSLTSGNREPSITPFQPVRQPREVPSCRSSLPVPPHALFKSQSNSFGLFRVYDIRTLPCHDPVLNELTSEHMKVDKPARGDNPFHPYPNESSMLLGEWYWNQSSLQSKNSFKRLLSIIGNQDFDPKDIRNTKWVMVDRELGELENKATEEWLNECEGWKKTSISISVPFHQCCLHLGPAQYSVEDFYHQSLVSVIHEKVLDPSHHRIFYYEPYELHWHPPHKDHPVRVHGEAFTSSAFLESHRQLQDSPAEPGCDLPRCIMALMFWSDATVLTSFGDTKLWPVYMYFGNESKYGRCQPSNHLCAHVAYLQMV